MMSQKQNRESKLFYHGINLESRVGQDHPLRRIAELVDFDFVRDEVAGYYGNNGQVSVDPAVILKLMFLLFFENIKSERELMRQLPLRLDWLWFCEYDIDDVTPNHSVLSKARKRWGKKVFESLFARILQKCIDADLVDGSIIHIDSSFVHANASKDKLQPDLQLITESICGKLEQNTDDDDDDTQKPISRKVTPVDPEARLAKKYGKTTLGYKNTRATDDSHGIITATVTTPANVNDPKILPAIVRQHQINTDTKHLTAVADRGYGTIETYKQLKDAGHNACIPHQRRAHKKNKLPQEEFHYDAENDFYVCPAQQKLSKARCVGQSDEYRCDRKICEQCRLFSDCVTSKKFGRTISRHVDSEYIDWADNALSPGKRKRLLARRRYKAEGSFADAANNHGFKRARWRSLEMVMIQNLVIAAVQNLRKLLRHSRIKKPAASTIGVNAAANWLLGQYCRLYKAIMSKYSIFKELTMRQYVKSHPNITWAKT